MKNKNIKNFTLVLIFLLVLIFFVGNKEVRESGSKILDTELQTNTVQYVKVAGQNIKVSLALTEEEHAQGLSGWSELKENEGMLFIFSQPGHYPFWMKGMDFPIDIIWLTEDMKVIYIKKDARPESYPETYGPDVSLMDAKYVLEVVSSFSDNNNLKEGDGVEFIY